MAERPEHLDVLIVGAGLSGIGAACRLRTEHPGRSVAILEARESSGGTWDLFRYPGIRSDSDMFTFGFKWRHWEGDVALADGPSILEYLRSVAREYGVDRLIRYRHRVVSASWDSETDLWTVEVDRDGTPVTLTTSFLWGCGGYYDYDAGYTPEFPGQESFGGTVVHPQHWPEDLDYAGKKVVVIGSGATAVTLVPAMARAGAEHVTMLQRSPTYILSLPGRDPIAKRLHWLPPKLRYSIVRWKAILLAVATYQLAQRRPAFVKKLIRSMVEKQLPPGVDVDTHFKPAYNPWDQRLCFVPDGDLFKAFRAGTASVVTDHIDTFTETGIRLRSGEELEADMVVTRDRADPQGNGRDRAHRRRRAGQDARNPDLQGVDAQRRAELRVHDRLHQRLLDAEGRPGRRLRVPAAHLHGHERRTTGGRAARPVGRRGAADHVQLRLHPAGPRRAAEAGRPRALEAAAELPQGPALHQPRPDRRRRPDVSLSPRLVTAPVPTREAVMGLKDKAENKAEELKGKGKESTGKATGDRDLEAEGKADQASGKVKQAGEHVKDAAKDVKDGLTR